MSSDCSLKQKITINALFLISIISVSVSASVTSRVYLYDQKNSLGLRPCFGNDCLTVDYSILIQKAMKESVPNNPQQPACSSQERDRLKCNEYKNLLGPLKCRNKYDCMKGRTCFLRHCMNKFNKPLCRSNRDCKAGVCINSKCVSNIINKHPKRDSHTVPIKKGLKKVCNKRKIKKKRVCTKKKAKKAKKVVKPIKKPVVKKTVKPKKHKIHKKSKFGRRILTRKEVEDKIKGKIIFKRNKRFIRRWTKVCFPKGSLKLKICKKYNCIPRVHYKKKKLIPKIRRILSRNEVETRIKGKIIYKRGKRFIRRRVRVCFLNGVKHIKTTKLEKRRIYNKK